MRVALVIVRELAQGQEPQQSLADSSSSQLSSKEGHTEFKRYILLFVSVTGQLISYVQLPFGFVPTLISG